MYRPGKSRIRKMGARFNSGWWLSSVLQSQSLLSITIFWHLRCAQGVLWKSRRWTRPGSSSCHQGIFNLTYKSPYNSNARPGIGATRPCYSEREIRLTAGLGRGVSRGDDREKRKASKGRKYSNRTRMMSESSIRKWDWGAAWTNSTALGNQH